VFLSDTPLPSPESLPVSIRPLLELQAARLRRSSFETDAKVLIAGIVRSIELGETVEYRDEGRIKVDADSIHGAPNGWFKPGAGEIEWFKDHEDGPEMVVVPAGSFVMGLPADETERNESEGLVHRVSFAQPFAVGRHAVTRGQFAAFVYSHDTGYYYAEDGAVVWKGNKRRFDASKSWRHPGFEQAGNHPVVCVNWDDAIAYTQWLAEITGRPYRLLTEAEWEYVARAGTSTPFWWGISISADQANFRSIGTLLGGGWQQPTVAVDQFAPNPWGLYQVHGNVREWCEDYISAPNDRILRGGSWYDLPQDLHVDLRFTDDSSRRHNIYGFRVARTLSP
jgi:formylglycine-generating enzyme required for sulfatase activity